MTNCKSTFSKITALILCLVTIFSIAALPISAATSGSKSATTINVKTKACYLYPGASSVTLKQSKQTLTYQQLIGAKTKPKTGYYGCYNITVYNVTKGISKNMNWSGGQTKKISLDPNCTYRITVKYDSLATDIFTRAPFGYKHIRTSAPSWWVNSTWKLSSCY